LIEVVTKFGDDVVKTPKKGSVSIIRKKRIKKLNKNK